jgi:WAS protein family, member 3
MQDLDKMPLIKRLVQPVDISRNVVPQHITNELECVANSTLAHIVRQLGSLSAHADDLFSELHREATGVICRVAQLTERIERVKGRIVKLNPTVEEGKSKLLTF